MGKDNQKHLVGQPIFRQIIKAYVNVFIDNALLFINRILLRI